MVMVKNIDKNGIDHSKNMNLDYQICYWRTFNQTEVDFVLYGERGIIAFEVKRPRKSV